jgi:hypothetical protein
MRQGGKEVERRLSEKEERRKEVKSGRNAEGV